MGPCRSYLAIAFPGLFIFRTARSSVSVLPLRILLQHLREHRRQGSAAARSIAARQYPWETPFHVGFFGALFSPEKSVFLFDPLLVAGDSACCRGVETVRARDQSLYRDGICAGAGLHQLLRALHGLERRLRLGRPLRLDQCPVRRAARRAITAAISRRPGQDCVDGWSRPFVRSAP